MSRLIQYALVLAALATSSSACQPANIDPPMPLEGGTLPPGDDPSDIFARDVRPLLVMKCEGCHADPSATPYTFLADEYYDSVLAHPGLVVAGDPSGSLLINKGAHRGRDWWSTTEMDAISAWIDAEDGGGPAVDAGLPPDLPTSAEVPITIGANRISLEDAGLPGAYVVFDASMISSGMMLRNVFFEAGGTGIAISHPRFVIYDAGTPMLDADRFSEVELRVDAAMMGLLTDQHILSGFPAAGELAIQFDSASST